MYILQEDCQEHNEIALHHRKENASFKDLFLYCNVHKLHLYRNFQTQVDKYIYIIINNLLKCF